MTFDSFLNWSSLLLIAYLGVIILLANILRSVVPFFKKSLLPTAVIGGFLALILKVTGIFDNIMLFNGNLFEQSNALYESITYHCIALGFIALSLKKVSKEEKEKKAKGASVRSGAVIVSTYLLQGALGMLITIIAAYIAFGNGTITGDEIAVNGASGILLPMGFGQGPGQANNIGSLLESLGLNGGKTFGLGIASLGFIWACIPGVIYLNYLLKKGKINRTVNLEQPEKSDEIMQAAEGNESVDRFSLQISLVLLVYLLSFGGAYLLSFLFSKMTFLGNQANALVQLVWGFNFIFGIVFAFAVKAIIQKLTAKNVFKKDIVNNYLMDRSAGFLFDLMIVTSICTIDVKTLLSNVVLLLVVTTVGGIATFFYLKWLCKKVYPEYEHEAMLSMYGMLTGTISTGVILLREIDPKFQTAASNNLVYGSSTAIIFGIPLLLMIGFAASSIGGMWAVFGIVILYGLALLAFVLKGKNLFKRNTQKEQIVSEE